MCYFYGDRRAQEEARRMMRETEDRKRREERAKKAEKELGVDSTAVREEGKRGVQGWSWSLPEG